jgi:hypothetical protein
MHSMLKQPGYRLYAAESPEARALLAEQGLGPADLDRALASLERTEGTAVPYRRRHQRRRRVRHQPRGLATGPARRLPRALHPAALGQGPRAARPRARRQHRAVHPGRHGAGRVRRLPAGQLREVTAMDTDQLEHDMNELCHEWMHGKPPSWRSS